MSDKSVASPATGAVNAGVREAVSDTASKASTAGEAAKALPKQNEAFRLMGMCSCSKSMGIHRNLADKTSRPSSIAPTLP
jgi:hypothetical protein